MWKKFTQALGKIVQKVFKKKSNQKVETPQELETEVVLFSADLRNKECTFTVDNATINVEALEVLAGKEKQATKNPQLPLNKSAQTHLRTRTPLVTTTTTIPQGFYTGVDLSRIEDGIAHFFMAAEQADYDACYIDSDFINKAIIVPFGEIYINNKGMWAWRSGCL